MNYKAEFNGIKRRIDTPEEWEDVLREVRQSGRSVLTVRQIKAEMKGLERLLYKMLGLTTDIEGFSAVLLTADNVSALTFSDAAGHELRVSSGKVGNGTSLEVMNFELGDGSVSTHPAEECLPRDEALRAMTEFYAAGEPPQWLSYRKVR